VFIFLDLVDGSKMGKYLRQSKRKRKNQFLKRAAIAGVAITMLYCGYQTIRYGVSKVGRLINEIELANKKVSEIEEPSEFPDYVLPPHQTNHKSLEDLANTTIELPNGMKMHIEKEGSSTQGKYIQYLQSQETYMRGDNNGS